VESVAATAAASAAVSGVEQLLCIAGDRSFVVAMPRAGELTIGRGRDADLMTDDPLVSRGHARLVAVPDGLQREDLGSRHGTLVNGERLAGPRQVAAGDVIAVGNAVLVVQRSGRPPATSSVADPPALIRRLTEELSRSVAYERELALVVARAADGDAPALLARVAVRLRAIDTVALLEGRLVCALLPEHGTDEALDFARALAAAGRLAVGVAVAPYDGIDPDALLGAARAACLAAELGRVVPARDAAEVIVAGGHRIVVADPAMVRLYELARRLARADIPIVIHGETGSGKELAAAAIHAFSSRAAGPFVSVNCAAIAESLAESELFGHARGAFSGAVAARAGHIEAASGGTLFLDEIAELSPAIQAKLLRALESGELIRVGESAPRASDVRIVAATHRDLRREVDAGRFRGDLFFRLGSARLELPPLRDRPRDIALLATGLLDEATRRLGRPPLALSIAAAVALLRYGWPGNIRELRHTIAYAAAAAPETAREIELWHLPAELATAARTIRDADVEPDRDPPAASAAAPGPPPHGGFRPIADEVRELERARMIIALRACGGVQTRAAALIEMALRTFVTKAKRYAITCAEWGGP